MSDARLPNLYQLLGITSLESDRGKIETAVKRLLQRAAERTGSDATAHAAEFQRIQKIAALARKYLLDPKLKPAYDQQWKAAYQLSAKPAKSATAAAVVEPPAPATTTTTGTTATTSLKPMSTATAVAARAAEAQAFVWDTSRLDQLLPGGDPQAPFDMAAYLRSADTRDPAAAEADLNKLIGLLSEGATAEEGQAAHCSDDDEPTAAQPSAVTRATSSAVSPFTSTATLAKRMQKKKQQSLLIGGIALATGLLGLAVLGVFLMQGTSNDIASGLADNNPRADAAARASRLPRDDSSTASGQLQETTSDQPVVGSGLPRPGAGNATLAIDSEMPIANQQRPSEATQSADSASPQAAANDSASATPAPLTPAVGAGLPDKQPENKQPDNKTAETMPPDTKLPDASLTAAEKQAWADGMLEAKKLIANHDFEAAQQKLDSLKASAKTAQQRGQWERLGQVNELMRDARQAIVAAISALDAAETFKIGKSTVASFIEGDASKITVQISGRDQSYALPEMPVAMGLALIDLKLDVAHANSLARKGAYIMLHPKNTLALQRGRQMLNEAADAGAISAELAKFYEDDYSLSTAP